MKKFLAVILSALAGIMIFMCACYPNDGRDGRDGKDGQDVTIDGIYEKYVEEYGEISFEDFLYKFLSYTNSELDEAVSLKTAINRSLMSGVSILSRFGYSSSHQSSIPGWQSNRTTYKVYTGSGVIVWLDKEAGDAYVVTNCHVIYDDTADSIFCNDVRLYLYGQDTNGVNFTVDENYGISGDENYCIKVDAIVGASVTYDIALLKVTGSEVLKRSDAVSAKFSTAEDVNVGETVYAIGNPSGEGMSASDGIISQDSEYITLSLSEKTYLTDSDYVQYRVMRTTAPINHGNSGGALYNSKGEIIGIVNAKDEGEDIDNMGYALPANSVRRLLGLMYDNYVSNGGKMNSNGGVDKALLNVETIISDTYARFNSEKGLAEIFELVKINKTSGAPANGKLQSGDILKAIKIEGSDGTIKEQMEVTRSYHVKEVLFSVRKGDTVTVTVERSGETIDVEIVFDSDKYFTHYV